jgi:hypothetical protein
MEDLLGHIKFMNDNSKSFMSCWKELRKNLTDDLSDIQHLELVTQFWSNAPISVRTLDWDDPGSWPDPWTFIHNNRFDESAVSVGMFYTLLLSRDSRWLGNRLQLILVSDQTRAIQRIILSVDNRWLLNLEYQKVINNQTVAKTYNIQQIYDYQDNHYFLLKSRRIASVGNIIKNNDTTL